MADNSKNRITLETLQGMKARGEKIASLTCYDASFTRVLETAGIEVFIIGDSLGMVIEGYDSTLPVTMSDMVYHAANVARTGQYALRVADMPYQSYQTPGQAQENATRLVQAGGADMAKVEGGADRAGIVKYLVKNNIPVCGHIGLLPQSIEKLGGYKVQGRDEAGARALLADARALEDAGAGLLVMECVPAELATRITRAIGIPTIGIGAGPGCDGQVLVLYDMLGITPGTYPRFVRNFMKNAGSVQGAIEAYVRAVKDGSYPDKEHSYR